MNNFCFIWFHNNVLLIFQNVRIFIRKIKFNSRTSSNRLAVAVFGYFVSKTILIKSPKHWPFSVSLVPISRLTRFTKFED